MIRVLVVEDSPVARDVLLHVLGSDPEVTIAGTALDGEAGVQAVLDTRPDVVTMDIHMPRLNGFDATRRIMEIRPTPIVIVSESANRNAQALAFQAVEAGALAVLPRPAGIGSVEFEQDAADLIRTVKLMSEVKVIRRWPARGINGLQSVRQLSAPPQAERSAGLAILAIGASTGGPPALHCILSQLPANFPAPIVVVQHIARGFAAGFAEWMAKAGKLPVHLAQHGEQMINGHVYIAPDDHHMKVVGGNHLILSHEAPEYGLRPSVAVLFRSVANVYGSRAAAALLSGMGTDGAAELKYMKDVGALTFAQDKASSAVHGMPGEAVRIGGATYVLAPEMIAETVARYAGVA